MAGTAEDARKLFKSWNGLKEGPAVDKAIINPWNKKTGRKPPAKSKTTPWCAIATASCLIQSGVKTLSTSAGCKQQVAYYKARKRWKARGTKPKAGWLVFYDFKKNKDGNPTHTGMITSADYKKKGYAYAIEGNKNDKVGYRHFSYAASNKSIVGYAVPYYK